VYGRLVDYDGRIVLVVDARVGYEEVLEWAPTDWMVREKVRESCGKESRDVYAT
jgi:hypothetical protein